MFITGSKTHHRLGCEAAYFSKFEHLHEQISLEHETSLKHQSSPPHPRAQQAPQQSLWITLCKAITPGNCVCVCASIHASTFERTPLNVCASVCEPRPFTLQRHLVPVTAAGPVVSGGREGENLKCFFTEWGGGGDTNSIVVSREWRGEERRMKVNLMHFLVVLLF